MKSGKTKSLAEELKRLITYEHGFDISLEVDSLPQEERELAGLFNKVLERCKIAKEYDLMKYKLAGDALGIAYWDMDVKNSDPANSGK